MNKQFTATVYVIDQDKVLLIKHKKFNKWLPAGGHVNPDELPADAALREVLEETGLEVEFIMDEHIWIDMPNAKSLPRPFLCMLFNVAARINEPCHQHIDFIYRAKPIGGQLRENLQETHGAKWFTIEEILSLEVGRDIWPDTLMTVQKILQNTLQAVSAGN